MLYILLRYLVRFAVKIYFEKVIFIGRENIPRDVPLVIASNHPTAFVEPCIYGSHFPIEIYFMTRGDLFHPRLRWFFKGTNQIPIFRRKDGINGLRKNTASFNRAYDVLSEKGRITIFPEATAIDTKRIRRLKNGAARLIIGTHEKYENIIPHFISVAANYENILRWRSIVFVSISESHDPSPYLKDTDSALDKITDVMYQNLRKQAIHIADKKDHEWVNVIIQIFTEAWRYGELKKSDEEMFYFLQEVAKVGEKPEMETENLQSNAEELLAINENTDTFTGTPIKKYHITDALELFLFSILSIPAIVFLGLPYLAGMFMLRRYKFSHEFKIPVFLGTLLTVGSIMAVILLLVLILNLHNWYLWAYLIILPFSMISFGIWGGHMQKLLMYLRFKDISDKERSRYADLRQKIIRHKLFSL